MKVVVVNDAAESTMISADIIEDIVKEETGCTLGLATGSTPIPVYQELARRCRENNLDFSGIHTVNLDEYAGLDGSHEQSYRYFMDKNFFDLINIDKANTYVAKGIGDISENLKEFQEVLEQTDIRLQLLGVGVDGHIGFNEPAAVLSDGPHIEVLDESTIDANARFFACREDVPTKAITMGIGNIMRAQELLLIISGNKKEAARKLLIDSKIDSLCPVTFLRLHRNATVIIEKSLANEIGYKE